MHKTVVVYCDYHTAISVQTIGHGRDPFLFSCACEIWLMSALGQFKVILSHKPVNELVIADALSRRQLNPNLEEKCSTLDTINR